MLHFTLATLRLGKASVKTILELNSQIYGVKDPPFEITVLCTQVPVDLAESHYVLIWLGSDNSKGQVTEWKQGFKAIGKVLSVNRSGQFSDNTETKVSIGYIFPVAVNRLDFLRDAPTAYYWASAMPIIGLDDHSNQTIRIIEPATERNDASALFYGLNIVSPSFFHDVETIYPELNETFNYSPPSPQSDGITLKEQQIKYKTGYISTFEHNRIVFGAPGTGKSYDLKNESKTLLLHTNGTYERVTFHPDYAYSHFVGTYKPVTDDVGEIRYEFVPGPFMRVYVDALKSGSCQEPQPHLLLIEEINRAKVAAVFGDVFQLLDRDDDGVSEYEIHATEDIRKHLAKELGGASNLYDRIRIPNNMFIWATMNSADQGVYPMDTAFKRRWDFEYLSINHNDSVISGKTVTLGTGSHAFDVDWNRLRKAINEKLAKEYKVNEDKLMGPFFLSKKFIITNKNDNRIANQARFKSVFKSKVIMYLYEDAAKQYRNKLFSGDGCDSSKYSSVCDAFDEIGIDIFGNGFREIYDQQGV